MHWFWCLIFIDSPLSKNLRPISLFHLGSLACQSDFVSSLHALNLRRARRLWEFWLWRFYFLMLWWQHLFFCTTSSLCVVLLFADLGRSRHQLLIEEKNQSRSSWITAIGVGVFFLLSQFYWFIPPILNWKRCSKTSFLNKMSLMGPKSHLRWAIFSLFGRFNLLTLSQGHREVCHFQGRNTFFGVFLLLRVPRDSGRELEDFCHLSAAFIKNMWFALEITTTISASWYFVLFDFAFAVEFPTL